jgi:uncharacterized delta-60 repeat protein
MISASKTRTLATTLTALVLGLTITGSAYAGPADLDPSFGTGGVIQQAVGASAAFGDVVPMPGGKFLAVGSNNAGGTGDFLLIKYNSDGSRDASFGNGGIVQSSFTKAAFASAAAVQSDGKIVVVGSVVDATVDRYDVVVARYNANGTLDTTSFGTGGSGGSTPVQLSAGPYDFAAGVAIAADGRIIVSATATNQMALVRFLPNGVIDSAFAPSTNGVRYTQFGSSSFAGEVAIQTDGKYVQAGTGSNGPDSDIFGVQASLVRYIPDPNVGYRDFSFSGDGIAETALPVGSGSDALVIQPDGKILSAGTSDVNHNAQIGNEARLSRFNPDGSLDLSFGIGGSTTVAPTGSSSGLDDLALQPNGEIVTVGNEYIDGHDRLAVMRFSPNGALDPSFGKYISPLPDATGSAALIQADGKIVVAGNSGPEDSESTLLMRFIGGNAAPAPVALSGKFTKFKSKIKASKFKKISGTAGGTGIAKVQLAIGQTDSSLLKKSGKGATRAYKAKKKKCAPSKWLTASGTTSWSFKLKKALKPAKYTIYLRVVGAGGATQTKFSKSLGNLRTVTLTK